jgi:hypothetical protein
MCGGKWWWGEGGYSPGPHAGRILFLKKLGRINKLVSKIHDSQQYFLIGDIHVAVGMRDGVVLSRESSL